MKSLFATLSLICLAATAAEVKTAPIDTPAAWSRLKSLVGEWEARGQMGTFHLKYELIAGGTALVERERGDNMPEMLTVYTVDGKRLLLTHYCAAGNQPRMEARSFDASTGELRFEFLDAGNLPNPETGHMHSAAMKLVDDRHLTAEWSFFEGGKLKTTETAQYTRIR